MFYFFGCYITLPCRWFYLGVQWYVSQSRLPKFDANILIENKRLYYRSLIKTDLRYI